MLTYLTRRRAAPLLSLVVLLALSSRGQAQERRYLFEVGAAGTFQGYGDDADLGGSAGGLARVGIWLPLNFSVELEGSTAGPTAQRANSGINVKTGWGAVLYNVLLGARNSGYVKLGVGGTDYGGTGPGECVGPRICGKTTTWVMGLGFRAGITPLIQLRSEAVLLPNRGNTQEVTDTGTIDRRVSFSNYGLNVGLSFMLGSKPIPDNDGDGVLNNRDRCTDTPQGAQVDGFG